MRQAEPGQQRHRPLLDVPGGTDDVEVVLGGGSRFDAVQCHADLGDAEEVVDALGVGETEVLAQIPEPAAHGDRPAQRTQLTGDQPQQGGLSRAVGADQADVAGTEVAVQAVEDVGAVGPGEGEIGKGQRGHGRPRSRVVTRRANAGRTRGRPQESTMGSDRRGRGRDPE
ncbi:Uncharacterised protein [Mycobacteroides abscessus subsp. abscessus]|nr:Uncharacterised protein [Mycobacteroides abscessus subsp. abscessus]